MPIAISDRKTFLILLAIIAFSVNFGLVNKARAAAPNPPSNLGPSNYTDGSWGNDNTPTLQFTQTDPDATSTVKFRIQIDDTSDYSSPVVDYTSGLLSQGTATFTVGQATSTDNGTYTVGQPGQTLSDGSYYWRVMSIDDTNATSTWTTATSGVAFRIDTSAPTSVSVTSITELTATDYQYASGTNIIYYNTATSSGSFIVNATATDPDSGIQKINFPATVSTGGDATTSPYSFTYSWNSSSTFSQSANIIAYNNAGGTTTAAFYVYLDTSPPSGGSITYTDGYYTTTSVSITVSDGTDSGSGVNTSSRVLQRREANLSGGSCGSYGSFANISVSGTYPNFTDDTVVSGKCYQYRYLVSDNVSNQATYSSVSTAKVDTAAPTSVSIVSIVPDSTSQLTVIATATDANSGLNATPFWFAEVSNNPGSSSSTSWQSSTNFVDTGLATNTQYTYKVKARDAAGNESAYSATFSKYTLAPTPTNLVGTADYTAITLSVDSFPNSSAGSSGYYFWRDGKSSGWIQNNSWQDTGLSCGTSYTYYVKYRNGDGVETGSISLNISTLSCTGGGVAGWYAPPRPPTGGFKVLINDGAKYTDNRRVTLKLIGGPDAESMIVSNFSDFRYAHKEKYAFTKDWDLCEGRSVCLDGEYIVYVKFYTRWDIASEVVSSSIVLKTTERPATKMTPEELKAFIEILAKIAQSRNQSYQRAEQQRVEKEISEIPPGYKFNVNLRPGQRGDDVRYLQIFLKAQGPEIYPEGIVSGWFGPLTKKAVIRFQEKYAEDILAPWGLTKGTGFVGETTRAKINELLGR